MSRPRAMLVEDEALVAMMMEDVLDQLGWEVVGSFADVRPALDWLSHCDGLEGAVLDINLGSETVYPVAEALQSRGTPFAFLTGYSVQEAAGRFNKPILSKPVDVDELEETLTRFRA
jgi:CheY-like chemotaxis protein